MSQKIHHSKSVAFKINLKEKDLPYRFRIAVFVVSKYFITWVCFLYYYFSEIDSSTRSWMPTVEQVKGTQPRTFKKITLVLTCIILDASEVVFIEICRYNYQHGPTTVQAPQHLQIFSRVHSKWCHKLCVCIIHGLLN